MSRLKTLEAEVFKILCEYPIARKDDRFLVTAVYSNYVNVNMPFKEVMKNYTLPPFESITRCRRKIQETNEKLRADYDTEQLRLELQEEYIEYAKGDESWTEENL